MSTQKLKSFAQRTSIFGVAISVLAAVVLPAQMAFADALNPLTERSLLLSSSAPGFQDSDGSGNTEGSPNAVLENYAPPGSGPNGKKTGQTFSFKVSTDSRTSKQLKGFSLQYCTTAAGKCQAPGNNVGDARVGAPLARGGDTATTSDLNVNYAPTATAGPGQDFQILVNNVDQSADWALDASNLESPDYISTSGDDNLTGKNNFIKLRYTGAGNGLIPNTGDPIKIIFKASPTSYITNPGKGSFFVKINTFQSGDLADIVPTNDADIVDGGVTVANVMTDSIHITTKVLETMSFSVGTRNRDTVVVRCNAGETNVPVGCEDDAAIHGTCDPIQQIDNNRLNLGNPNAEFSLETGKTWDVFSYWRLSSNSSGGATVYYSGDTLKNTVGDRIRPIGGAAATSTRGTEQFGLGFVNAGTNSGVDTIDPALSSQYNPGDDSVPYRIPSLTRDDLAPVGAYANGTGGINEGEPSPASFAFVSESNLVPAKIAENSDNVISCATAKMRYIANIGADTPAGVYTTKINYLAAPQY